MLPVAQRCGEKKRIATKARKAATKASKAATGAGKAASRARRIATRARRNTTGTGKIATKRRMIAAGTRKVATRARAVLGVGVVVVGFRNMRHIATRKAVQVSTDTNRTGMSIKTTCHWLP